MAGFEDIGGDLNTRAGVMGQVQEGLTHHRMDDWHHSLPPLGSASSIAGFLGMHLLLWCFFCCMFPHLKYKAMGNERRWGFRQAISGYA